MLSAFNTSRVSLAGVPYSLKHDSTTQVLSLSQPFDLSSLRFVVSLSSPSATKPCIRVIYSSLPFVTALLRYNWYTNNCTFDVYNLMGVGIGKHPCYHHHSQSSRSTWHLSKFPCATLFFCLSGFLGFFVVRDLTWDPPYGKQYGFLQKLKVELPSDPAIPFQHKQPKELKSDSQNDDCTPMFMHKVR